VQKRIQISISCSKNLLNVDNTDIQRLIQLKEMLMIIITPLWILEKQDEHKINHVNVDSILYFYQYEQIVKFKT
jgi:hypothetical protein